MRKPRPANILAFSRAQTPNGGHVAGHRVTRRLASIEVANVQGLFEEFKSRGVEFPQKLKKQAWGGIDFQVGDPDGNVISFVTYEYVERS
jgi:uncharacterized glyoxalase superfamily protein PhnB